MKSLNPGGIDGPETDVEEERGFVMGLRGIGLSEFVIWMGWFLLEKLGEKLL